MQSVLIRVYCVLKCLSFLYTPPPKKKFFTEFYNALCTNQSWIYVLFKALELFALATDQPIQNEDPIYLFPRGNKPLLYHQIGNRNFFIFITNQ